MTHLTIDLVAVPLLVFFGLMLILKPGSYELDFDVNHGTFISLYGPYGRIACGISIAGFIGAFVFSYASPDAALCLFLSAIEALLFAVWLLFRYERYLHARYPRSGGLGASNYTKLAYAVTVSLGFSALFMFVLGASVAMNTLLER